MGPVIFITGNPAAAPLSAKPAISFNGGDLHHRKPLEGTETSSRSPASMGPVIFITGNTGVDPANLLILALQWGR